MLVLYDFKLALLGDEYNKYGNEFNLEHFQKQRLYETRNQRKIRESKDLTIRQIHIEMERLACDELGLAPDYTLKEERDGKLGCIGAEGRPLRTGILRLV